MQDATGKIRPAETPLRTPVEKKAKITTPSSGSTKRSGYVHVATPYPSSKQVKKIPSIIESSKETPGYSCESCSKLFLDTLYPNRLPSKCYHVFSHIGLFAFCSGLSTPRSGYSLQAKA